MGIKLKTDDFIYPYFVMAGKNLPYAINRFPGIHRFSIHRLLKDIEVVEGLGIRKILLFGIPEYKDEAGSCAYGKKAIVSLAVRQIKDRFPGMTVISDVCLCAYTSHGHCGIIKDRRLAYPSSGGERRYHFIDNGRTLKALSEMALAHADAGVDYVAPSAMAKRQVFAIRRALDKNGFKNVKIMAYSAKFASSFYGPFREVAGSAPQSGNRSSYQLDYRTLEESIQEVGDDIMEGADIVMVKPALSYLDVIKEASLNFSRTLAAYNVSGEYAMVKYAAKAGVVDERKAVFEIMTAIKRAGADLIISYHAKDMGKWLKKERS